MKTTVDIPDDLLIAAKKRAAESAAAVASTHCGWVAPAARLQDSAATGEVAPGAMGNRGRRTTSRSGCGGSNADARVVAGVRIFDLQIALTAIENGAHEIWTHDVKFLRVPGLRVHDPLTRA